MAHPDRKRQGSEKGQREHAGPTSEASDAGMQSHSQGARGKGPTISEEPAAVEGRGTSDDKRGLVAHEERDDGQGPVPERGFDRDAGAGAAGGRDTSVGTPSGHAREAEGRGSMSDRGLEVSGGSAERGRKTQQASPEDTARHGVPGRQRRGPQER